MKQNIRIARELVRIANELLSQNKEQAIADAVERINAVVMDESRTASIGDGKLKSIVLGTLVALSLAFGFDAAIKAIHRSMLDRNEQETVEHRLRNEIILSVKNGKWEVDGSRGSSDDVLFSMSKNVGVDRFFHAVGRRNENGCLDISVFSGSRASGMVDYPAIGVKTFKTFSLSSVPDQDVCKAADDIVLKELLKF